MSQHLQTKRQFSSVIVMTILLIGFISVNAVTGYADGCSGANFKGAYNIVFGQYPYALATADFNNDGKADMAAADYFGNGVRVAFGNGAGGFGAVSTYATGTKPIAIAVGDLSNDLRPDLVVTNLDSNDISVLINNGSGSFTVTNYAAGVGPGELALGDFTGDGMPDVAVTNQPNGTIILFTNNGGGGLLPNSSLVLPPASNPMDVVSADFNNDGKADLATANNVGTVSVFLRNGPSTFDSPTTTAVPTVFDLKGIAVGDFTGDTKLDLVVVSYGNGQVFVLPGNGTGGFNFASGINFPSGSSVSVYLIDLNSDGKLDILTPVYTTTLNTSLTVVMYGDGLGSLTQTKLVHMGGGLRSLAIADFNSDLKLDVAGNLLTFLTGGISVSLNNGAGELDTATFISTSSTSFGSSKISDFNLDGRPDLAWVAGNNVRVRLGLPNGELGSETLFTTSGPNHLDVGDFNSDGRPDIVTSNGSSNGINVLLNNGSGGFTATNYIVGGTTRSVVVGDFTNDGKLDLAVTANSGFAVVIFTGNGLGSFVLTHTRPLTANPVAIVAGDFNNDSNLDVITANECIGGGCVSKLITFFPGNGAGSLGTAVDLTTTNAPATSGFPNLFPNFLAAADFNGDGRLDLTWGRSNPGSSFSPLQVALNSGGGNFATPISLSASLDSTAVAVGDVNNDGRPDIVAGSGGSEIQVFLNNGGATFAPPVNYTGVPQSTGVTIGDINNDGKRDIIFSLTGAIMRLLNKCALSRGAHTPDFDGDGITDISVFRPSTGTWYLLYSSDGSFHAIPFGTMGDVPVVGDYDGDGKSDVAVFRPINGVWYYLKSSDGSFQYQAFGTNGDIPVPGDYDGDGLTNFAVWRPTTGYWYTSLNPATNFGAVLWGQLNDRPVQADYDGDGRTDIAIYRPTSAYWYLLRSSLGYQEQQFGIPNDVPVPADFNNDGKADFAVYRDSTGWWYTSLNPATNFGGIQLGQSGDVPVPGFYDADGRADAAVFRLGDWYIHQSNTGGVFGTHFGSSGDEAAPSAIRHP